MENEIQEVKRKYYTTGLCLDYYDDKLNPLVPEKSMMMIIGKSDCDKDTLAVQIANNIVKESDEVTIFHYSLNEGKMKLVDNSNNNYMHHCTILSYERLYQKVKNINDIKIEKNITNPTIFILNTNCIKKTEDDELLEARLRMEVFKRIVKMCADTNMIFILITTIEETESHKTVREFWPQIMTYLEQNERLPIGNTPVFLSNFAIRIDKDSGDTFNIRIVKSARYYDRNYKLKLENGRYKDLNKNE